MTDKRAIVTGGASGIGLAVCRELSARGARVAVLDLDGDGAKRSAEAVGGIAYTVDVRDHDRMHEVIQRAADELGGLDVLVNNAGVGQLASLHEYSADQWQRIIQVNLAGVFHGMKAAVPIMRRSGAGGGGRRVRDNRATGGASIVNNASLSGLRPTRGETPYSAAKAGVIALTQGAAQEYGPEIRINCVSPGLIRTPMTEPLFAAGETVEPIEREIPLRRAGHADEVAAVIAFLASDEASYLTGQNIVVDGGMSLPQVGIDRLLRELVGSGSNR